MSHKQLSPAHHLTELLRASLLWHFGNVVAMSAEIPTQELHEGAEEIAETLLSEVE